MFLVLVLKNSLCKGVAAGSIAAAIHSGIGNVAAGSAFAIAQSWGATGYAVNSIRGAVGATWGYLFGQ